MKIRTGKLAFKLNFIFTLGVLLSYAQTAIANGPEKANANFNYSYNWLQNPSADAESIDVSLSFLYYDSSLTLTKCNQQSVIRIKGDSVYLPIVHISSPSYYDQKEGRYSDFVTFSGWLRGIIANNTVTFSEDDYVARVARDAVTEGDNSTTISANLTLKLRGASNFGPKNLEYSNTVTDQYQSTTIDFDQTRENVTGLFNRNTGLLTHLNSGFTLSTEYPKYLHITFSQYRGNSRTLNTQAILGLLVGKVSDAAPRALPKPEISLRYSTYSRHAHGGYFYVEKSPEVDVKMNIANNDGTLIDQNKLFIKIWIDNETEKTLPFSEYGNPYDSACLYAVKLPSYESQSGNDPEIRIHGYCYYQKDDGTVIKSPEFTYTTAEISIPTDDSPTSEAKTYDLTGREIKGEPSAPGIYIRNGRKFIIR